MNHSAFSAFRSWMWTAIPFALVACGGGSDASTDAAQAGSVEQAAGLDQARESFEATKAAADACVASYKECEAKDGAEKENCRKALHDCLPERPKPPAACQEPNDGDEKGGPPRGHGKKGRGPGRHPHGGEQDAEDGPGCDRKGPPPDGAGGPPRGLEGREDDSNGDSVDGNETRRHGPGKGKGKGEGRGEDHGKGKRHPACGQPPLPPLDAMKACHEPLEGCLKEKGGDAEGVKACREAHGACLKEAFAKGFEEHCAKAKADCSNGTIPKEACEKIEKRCAEGVVLPPPPPPPPADAPSRSSDQAPIP